MNSLITPSPAVSQTTPVLASVATLVAAFYADAPNSMRMRLLDKLLRPVGPLALGAIAAGACARLLPPERWTGVHVHLEDAVRISAAQVFELARYLEQKCPEWMLQLPELLGDSLVALDTRSGVLLMEALRASRRRVR